MIISPIPSASSAVTQPAGSQPSSVQALRSLTMRTNANPNYIDPTAQQGQAPVDPNELSNDSAEATQPISPQFAALAKQRRALQVMKRELDAREKALSSPVPDKETIALAKLKAQPLDVLLEAGVTYEQLTEAILANQGNSEINDLKAKLKALEEGVDKKLTDRDTQSEQQVLAEMRKEAEQLAAEGDTFEMVRGTGSIPDVMKLIERTYRESGEVLDVSEALQLVEDELFKEAQKIASFKKVQSQYFPPAQPQMQRQQGMRTLTNRDTASIPMSAKARALAAFNGTLKR